MGSTTPPRRTAAPPPRRDTCFPKSSGNRIRTIHATRPPAVSYGNLEATVETNYKEKEDRKPRTHTEDKESLINAIMFYPIGDMCFSD